MSREQTSRDSANIAIADGGNAFDLTADSLVSGADVAVMIDLANAGAVSGTSGSLRAATVRYDYRNQMVEYAADDGFGPHT